MYHYECSIQSKVQVHNDQFKYEYEIENEHETENEKKINECQMNLKSNMKLLKRTKT